ncbi:MAG: GIY-YIG nuclease family protein [Patescibacteria group bacterium]
MYYTYVLNCRKQKSEKLYVGYCRDLKQRLSRHLKKEIQTTKKFDKIKLVYYEACLDKTDAIKRENQLKTGFGRGYLKRRLKSCFDKRD